MNWIFFTETKTYFSLLISQQVSLVVFVSSMFATSHVIQQMFQLPVCAFTLFCLKKHLKQVEALDKNWISFFFFQNFGFPITPFHRDTPKYTQKFQRDGNPVNNDPVTDWLVTLSCFTRWSYSAPVRPSWWSPAQELICGGGRRRRAKGWNRAKDCWTTPSCKAQRPEWLFDNL